MTNRKYRLICALNALERRLRLLQASNGTAASILAALHDELPAIIAITATPDVRYLRGRVTCMLESYYGQEGLEQAMEQVSRVLERAGRIDAPRAVRSLAAPEGM